MFTIAPRTGQTLMAREVRPGDKIYRMGAVVIVTNSYVTVSREWYIRTNDGHAFLYPQDELFEIY